MKKIKEFVKKLHAPIPTLCYTAAVCIALLIGLFNFGYDFIGRMTGSIRTIPLAPQDFELVNITVQENGELLSDTDDPQLVLDLPPTRVRRISMQVTYDRAPYERCVYYTKKEGAAFNALVRVWPTDLDDSKTTLYDLPIGAKSIRIDPGSLRSLWMNVESIVLNPPRPVWTYFVPDGGGLFYLAVLPGLAAAIIRWLIECKRHYFHK